MLISDIWVANQFLLTPSISLRCIDRDYTGEILYGDHLNQSGYFYRKNWPRIVIEQQES